MIAELFAAGVVTVETYRDEPDAYLFPQELEQIECAVPGRRAEFATTRQCARLAMARLGRPATVLLRVDHGEPCWPPGIVGSMTHCAGFRAASVAEAAVVSAVGIDAEPHAALPTGILERISLPAERAHLAELVAPDRLLFSCKESVYKAWFPLTRRWLGFDDVLITIEAAGTFEARLLVRGPTVDGRELAVLAGRWGTVDGLVGTAISVPRF
jgi:4'-phosphopantetheinyl transferase EntD